MSSKTKTAPIDAIVTKLGIGHYQRHILICAGPNCCSTDAGEQLWQYTKQRLKELGLANGQVYRTKAACLRICRDGPVAVVYPDGTWYRQLDEPKMERIITEHLIDGRPVEEYAFARNPLG